MTTPPGFEWDAAMSARCETEYGFSFSDLVHVFEDEEFDYLRLGPLDHEGEPRYVAIGRLAWGTIVAVVYTMRLGRRRIIWVRPARKKERALFTAQLGG